MPKTPDQESGLTLFIGIGNPSTKPIFDQAATAKFVKNTFPIRGLQIKPTEFPRLPDATEEIKELQGQFKNSQVFLEEQASLVRGLQAASNMSMKNSVALVLATHGFVPNAERGLFLPRLLSVENNKTALVSNSDIESAYLPNSVVFLSACDTASGLTETPDLFFTGFAESFANTGSQLLMASLWPVHSITSKIVTTSFFEAWRSASIIDSLGQQPTASRTENVFYLLFSSCPRSHRQSCTFPFSSNVVRLKSKTLLNHASF